MDNRGGSKVWVISHILVLFWVAVLAVEDWTKRSVSIKSIITGAVSVCILLIITVSTIEELWSHALGAICGSIFLIVSKCSNEKLGYGDSMVLAILGAFLGITEFLGIAFVGFVLCGFYGGVRFIIKKGAKNQEIPFIPFLLIAYIGICCHMLIGGV